MYHRIMEGAGETKVWKKELEDERCHLLEALVDKTALAEKSRSAQLWKVDCEGEALSGDHGRCCVHVTATTVDLPPRVWEWAAVAEDSQPLGRRKQVRHGAEGSENPLGPTRPCWIAIAEGDLQSYPSLPLCFTCTSQILGKFLFGQS